MSGSFQLWIGWYGLIGSVVESGMVGASRLRDANFSRAGRDEEQHAHRRDHDLNEETGRKGRKRSNDGGGHGERSLVCLLPAVLEVMEQSSAEATSGNVPRER
jgi:hypothetical protein